MFLLLNLPNELICRVCDYVSPADIEVFATCNKNIYACAHGNLQKHLLLKEKYKNIVFYDDRKLHSSESLFVQEMCDNSDLTFYPKHLQLHPKDHDDEMEESDHVTYKDFLTPDLSSRLQAFVHDSPFLPLRGDSIYTIPSSGPMEKSAVIAVLLIILPNLRSFTGSDRSGTRLKINNRVRKVVRRIADINRDREHPSYGRALSQLREYKMNHNNSLDNGEGQSRYMFKPFATLPSMRLIHGHLLCYRYRSHAYFMRQSTLKSFPLTVTELCFTESAIDCLVFEDLFAQIAALQKFTYHHGLLGPLYQPRRIVESLRQYASTSLELLALSADPGLCSHVEEKDQGVGSLTMFSVLNTIKVDDEIFVKWDSGGPDDEEASEGGSYKASNYTDDRRTMERLVDVLPNTMGNISLTLHGNDKEMFEDLVEMKEERLPKLKGVTFENPCSFHLHLSKALEGVGVSVDCLHINSY